MQIKNVNKQLTEYTTDQINHTIALYIMKKCCEDGKISRTAYEKMTRKYEKTLQFKLIYAKVYIGRREARVVP